MSTRLTESDPYIRMMWQSKMWCLAAPGSDSVTEDIVDENMAMPPIVVIILPVIAAVVINYLASRARPARRRAYAVNRA